MPDSTPAAAGQPTAQPGQQAQAPFGASPATGPTPNRGYEAAAKQQLGVVLHQLERMVPMVGAASEIGKDVMKIISMIAKHVQPGEVTPAAQKNSIDKMSMQNQQNMAMQAQLRQSQAQPGGGQMPKAA